VGQRGKLEGDPALKQACEVPQRGMMEPTQAAGKQSNGLSWQPTPRPLAGHAKASPASHALQAMPMQPAPAPQAPPVRLQLTGMGATRAAVSVFWMTSSGSL